MTEQNVWTATPDGAACRASFEAGRTFGMGVEFNPTTEHYHRDNGIGYFDAYHDGEWQDWRRAWQAARAQSARQQQDDMGTLTLKEIDSIDMALGILINVRDGDLDFWGRVNDAIAGLEEIINGPLPPVSSGLSREQKSALKQAIDVMGANGFHWVAETLLTIGDEK